MDNRFYNTGLGDTLEELFNRYNITPEKIRKIKAFILRKNIEDVSCGCEARKKFLNKWFPYFWRK